jgi:hypothetical protein
MFEAINIVNLGLVWINKRYVNFINCVVAVFQLIGFRYLLKPVIYWDWIKRLHKKAVLGLTPKYMYVSYYFLFFFLKRIPLDTEIINPINIDIYRASGYANILQ